MIKSKTTTGLGKGLSAIFDIEEQNVPRRNFKSSGIAEIELSMIDANPYQPRTIFDATALAELSQSIERLGVIQPITVRVSEGGRYMIISGERRYRASLTAGRTTIPAYIREASDEMVLELALVENIQREDLNAMEVALTMQRLIEECKLTQEMLSERVGKNRATIANYIRLLKLPAEIQLALSEDIITMGHARALITIQSREQQLKLLERIIKNSLSVRQIEQIVKQLNEPKLPGADIAVADVDMPHSYTNLSARLESILGHKSVAIKKGANGGGKIVIKFESDSDIDRILEQFS